MRSGFTRSTLQLMAAATLVAAAMPASAPADPAPQAATINAEFLARTPAPESGAATICNIDTGADPLVDTTNAFVDRLSLVGGSGDDVYVHVEDLTSGHGTYVTGVEASAIDEHGSQGIWPAVKTVSVRVFSGIETGSTASDYERAIRACFNRLDVRVINLSLGGLEASSSELAALESRVIYAKSRGIDVVAAAGNTGGAGTYPAKFPDSFSVGGVDASGGLCALSARGPEVDVAAQGCDVGLTLRDGSYGVGEGTSFAAPAVSAVLAALRNYRPGLTPDQAEQLLVSTARVTAVGLVVDAEAAFRAAGLSWVVDAQNLRLPPSIEPERPSSATPTDSAHVQVVMTHRLATIPFRLPRPHGTASYRGRWVTVRVSNRPVGVETVFVVGAETYRRTGSTLRLRVGKARTVSIMFRLKGMVSSRTSIKVHASRRVTKGVTSGNHAGATRSDE